MIERWSGVSGRCVIEIEEPIDGLDFLLVPGVITIDFESSGYYDPGSSRGHPDNWYPAEGEDDRVPVGGYSEDDEYIVNFTPEQLALVAEHFSDEIAEVEIDRGCDDCDCGFELDYDDYYDY